MAAVVRAKNLLCTLLALATGAGSVRPAIANNRILLKSQVPRFDYSAPGAALQGRIEQVAAAERGSKLPIELTINSEPSNATGTVKPEAPKTAPRRRIQSPLKSTISSSGHGTMAGQLKPETAGLAAAITGQTAVESARVSMSTVKSTSSALHAPEEKSKPAFSDLLSEMWGGRLKIVSYDRFQSDSSLRLRLAVGESGSVVFRFLKGSDGNPYLKPTMIFFSGRDVPYQDSFEQQLFGEVDPDDTQVNQSKQTIYNIGHFLAPLTNWIIPEQPPPPMHIGFVYMSLGDARAYDKIGNRFTQRTVHNSLKALGLDTIEQDLVIELSSTDSGAISAYNETVVRLIRHDPHSALAKVVRVTYAADRTLVRRIMLEGWVSTDWQNAANEDALDHSAREADVRSTAMQI